MPEINTKLKIVTYIDRVNILSDIFIKYYTKFLKHEEFYFLILNTNYNEVSNYLKSKNFLESSFEMVYNDHIGIPKIITIGTNIIINIQKIKIQNKTTDKITITYTLIL